MGGLWSRAISSGTFFGIWPLFMKFSGINNPNVATMLMEVIVLLVLLPLGFRDWKTTDLSQANWKFLVLSAVSAAAGVLIFNGGIEKASRESLSTFIAVVILVQVIVTAINKALVAGSLTTSQLFGFAFAAVAAYLLSE